jgi:hypothetical protein
MAEKADNFSSNMLWHSFDEVIVIVKTIFKNF